MSQSEAKNVAVGLASVGTTAAAGKQIGTYSFFSQFATCAVASPACVLPNKPLLFPQVYNVRNDGVSTLHVFPSNATTTQGTIDGRAAGSAYLLAPNCSVDFIASSSPNDGVTGATWFSARLTGRNRPVKYVAAAVTLVKQDSGCIIAVDQGAVYTITMPDPTEQEGMEFLIDVETKANNIVTIDCGAGLLEGGVTRCIAAGTTSVEASASQNVVLTGDSPVGTQIMLRSNGADWKVSGFTNVAAKVTFS